MEVQFFKCRKVEPRRKTLLALPCWVSQFANWPESMEPSFANWDTLLLTFIYRQIIQTFAPFSSQLQDIEALFQNGKCQKVKLPRWPCFQNGFKSSVSLPNDKIYPVLFYQFFSKITQDALRNFFFQFSCRNKNKGRKKWS